MKGVTSVGYRVSGITTETSGVAAKAVELLKKVGS